MKIDRHTRTAFRFIVKLRTSARLRALPMLARIVLATLILSSAAALAQNVSQEPAGNQTEKNLEQSDPQADAVLLKTLSLLVNGPAFDAKVRQTVWATGREVVGVGTYLQAGGGSGAYNLQVTMHDGDGKHRLQQISDGILAWTRTEIAGQVSLRRVDVGRLEEWVGDASHGNISPRLTVGAWAEMLSTIRSHYALRVHSGHLKEEPVWIISGTLRPSVRQQTLDDNQRESWPMLYPTRVMVALQRNQDETGFGQLLPIRIEYWSDPITSADASLSDKRQGRMITLFELYSIRQITSPALGRFRFDNLEAEVNFVEDTDRYVRIYGLELTQGQRQLLRR
ncbi:MAG: hypothetical protein AB8B91_18055 [Rubripirellula sp.]